MPSDTTIEKCDPVVGVTVRDPEAGVIYLLPSASGVAGRPAYVGSDAILVKLAAANGVAMEYALPEAEREFVDYFSAAIDVIGLTVAVIGLVPSTIQGIQSVIELAAMRRGYKGVAVKRAKVSLRIDFLRTPSAEASGIRIKGDAESVVEALGKLSGHS